MDIPIWVFSVLFFLLVRAAKPEEDGVKQAMIKFIEELSGQIDQNLGWNMSSDPCTDSWFGVSCDSKNVSVRRIVLEELNFNGTLDAKSLCNTTQSSLTVLSLIGNRVAGNLPEEIGDCRKLTHLYLGRNQFSGSLPSSLSRLSNLKRLDISDNGFSGELPGIGRISGLLSFLAENNDLSGSIPEFDFSNLEDFNVSNNNFSGQVPDVQGRFGSDSFLGNPRLCGELQSNPCPQPHKKPGRSKITKALIYSGYVILGLIVVLFIAYRLRKAMLSKRRKSSADRGVAGENKSNKSSNASSDYKSSEKSDNSTSIEGLSPSPLVVLNGGPVVKGLRFEDLLRAPAELLGKGKHGSLYKVLLGEGVTLAVKRIKDWNIRKEEFKRRIKRIDQVKHPNVLSALAFYCSKQEKLLAYEYQQNGSLSKLLHGSQMFDWGSRLGVAAKIAEALAFMHKELGEDGIAHGNLKCTNVLFKNNMEPCISEYGLMVFENEQEHTSAFSVDVYGFGVILLELLTGKLRENNGADLVRWVHSVVSEEWTVEVFDKALFTEDASEERMVNLLQVALKCLSQDPSERPSMNQVVGMINAIKEDEERSTNSDQW